MYSPKNNEISFICDDNEFLTKPYYFVTYYNSCFLENIISIAKLYVLTWITSRYRL